MEKALEMKMSLYSLFVPETQNIILLEINREIQK